MNKTPAKTSTSTGPTVLKKKVTKPVEAAAPVTAPAAPAASGEKKHTASKTTTGNIDKIISALIDLSQKNGKLDEASVRKALKELLPSTSEFRNKKHKRPEGQPKKALSSYMFFTIKNRDAVQSSDASLKFQDITKELGRRWKALDATGKQQYEDMAKGDKVRYTKDMEEYVKLQAPVVVEVTEGSESKPKVAKPRTKKAAVEPAAVTA